MYHIISNYVSISITFLHAMLFYVLTKESICTVGPSIQEKGLISIIKGTEKYWSEDAKAEEGDTVYHYVSVTVTTITSKKKIRPI